MPGLKLFPLAELKPGGGAIVKKITAPITIAKRLADLGLTSGTFLKVVRRACLNGPIEINLKGFNLVIGRGVAQQILVQIHDSETT